MAIVAVEGEIDADTSPQLRQCFDKLLAEGEQRYVIDMTETDFIDSSGLVALVMLLKRIKAGQGGIKLCCIKPEILKIFELTRLDQVFDICATRAEAMESFQ